MAGFIILPRELDEDWGWGTDPLMSHVLVKVLFKANFKESVWKGKTVERGAFVTSIRKLSIEIGLSVGQLQRCLKRLVGVGLIVLESTNRWTKITVCDYDKYQLKDYIKPVAQSERPKKEVDETQAAVERLYAMYPSYVVRKEGNKVALRSGKDKEKLERLLRTKTEDELADTIRKYLDSKPGIYIKMFSTFLNNLPDYGDQNAQRQAPPRDEKTNRTQRNILEEEAESQRLADELFRRDLESGKIKIENNEADGTFNF